MSESNQSGAGRREVAYRLFATEFEDADLSYSESDEERAPNYVVTPTGARVNRLFVVGVLTEVEQVSEDVLRGRVVDPTGAFVLYAGQYQPDEMAFLEGADPPTFVAVTGKARTFQPADSDRVFTSIRPETINEVDAETRDRWTVQAAEHTLDRIAHTAAALAREERGDDLEAALLESGVDEGLAAGIPVAIDHYGTTPTYLAALRETAVDAARVVAGTTDEVSAPEERPDAQGDAHLGDLVDSGVNLGRTAADSDPAEAAEPAETTTEPAGSESDTEATGVSPSAGTTAAGDEGPSGSATSSGGAAAGEQVTTEAGPTGENTTESSSSGGGRMTDDDAEATAETVDEGTTSEETVEAADSTADEEGLGDFDPGEYELEEETREQIEEEYGTEFQTGTEVDEPGSADVEPDGPGQEPAEPAAGDAETDDSAGGTAPAPSETAASEPADAADEAETEEPEDLQAGVVELMGDLDDGTGADRAALIETATDRWGVSPDDIEGAIQGALMDGQCYEPDDETLKPI